MRCNDTFLEQFLYHFYQYNINLQILGTVIEFVISMP